METPTEPNVSRGKQFADFFALKRNLIIILISIFVIGMGEELWMRFVPKYLKTLGATVAANRYSMGIGVQMIIKRVPIMIAPLMGGILIDRFGIVPGVRIALIASIVLSGITFLALRELREETKEVGEPVSPPERWN